MLASAEKDPADGADITVVAAPGRGDVAHGEQTIIRRVEVDPTDARAEHGDPGVRSIGADEPGLPRRWDSFEVTAHVAGGQSH